MIEEYQTVRYQGTITEWNDDRGFGFVTTNGTGERYFFHVSDLQGSALRPVLGKVLTYEVAARSGKKTAAVKLRYPGVNPRPEPQRGRPWGWTPDTFIAAGHLAIPAWLVANGKLPALLIAIIVGMSCIAFVMYNVDKRRAERDARRIPERDLQFVGLAGGWLGALTAQKLFRHKTTKPSYVHAFRFNGVLGLAAMWGAAQISLGTTLTQLF